MRIIITEAQLKRVLLNETKQEVITDEYLNKAVSIVKKLISRGFNDDESCAIAGNMWAESQFDATIKSSNGAIGLIQWLGDRKKALINFATHKESKWSNENTQLDFIKLELVDGYKIKGEFIPNLSKDIKSAPEYEINNFNAAMKSDTIPAKAYSFAKKVERCDDCNGTLDIRKQSAKRIHDYYVGTYVPTDKKETKPVEKKQSSGSNKVGTVVYPKKSGDGYVNVRSKGNRDSERIAKISSPSKIGKVTEEKTDGEGKKWYKVTLDKKVGDYASGWVRSDMVE